MEKQESLLKMEIALLSLGLLTGTEKELDLENALAKFYQLILKLIIIECSNIWKIY